MPSKKAKPKIVSVPVTASVYDASTLFLHSGIGKAERDGKTWEMSLVNGHVPAVRLPDGRYVVFPWQELAEAASTL